MSERADTERAREVRRRIASELLGRDGVVSVGVGLDDEGRPAVVVGTGTRQDAEALALPREVDGVPVIVRVSGPFEAR